jgi:hypothetical protein
MLKKQENIMTLKKLLIAVAVVALNVAPAHALTGQVTALVVDNA